MGPSRNKRKRKRAGIGLATQQGAMARKKDKRETNNKESRGICHPSSGSQAEGKRKILTDAKTECDIIRKGRKGRERRRSQTGRGLTTDRFHRRIVRELESTPNIKIKFVRAHTGGVDRASIMNGEADMAAKEARERRWRRDCDG